MNFFNLFKIDKKLNLIRFTLLMKLESNRDHHQGQNQT
jgi:hypothetical protein